MTCDRDNKRASRTCKFDVEFLGERIAPAHTGIIAAGGEVHLNLIEKLPLAKHDIVGLARLEFEKKLIEFRHRHEFVAGKPVVFPPAVYAKSVTNPSATNQTVSYQPTTVTAPVTITGGTVSTTQPVISQPIISTSPLTLTARPVLYTPPLPVTSTVPDNVAPSLATIYEQYENNPAAFTGASSATDGANLVLVKGDDFGITVRDNNPAEFQSLVSELVNAGMTITVSSATYGIVTGMLPISELLNVAGFSDTVSISPEMAAILQ
jgi:hypothetical protein